MRAMEIQYVGLLEHDYVIRKQSRINNRISISIMARNMEEQGKQQNWYYVILYENNGNSISRVFRG